MDHFTYREGKLYAEDVAVSAIEAEVGTPFYCYSTATLVRHYTVIADVFKTIEATICYAVKANSNLAVLRTLGGLGAGADTVSEGEIRRSLAAGIPANKIVFSGVGKTRGEMRFALERGILQFNVESQAELLALDEVAKSLGVKAPIAFRVNPDVDAGSHDKISTGRRTDKFGIAWDQVHAMYEKAAALDHIEIVGISTHIGSQLVELGPFDRAFRRLAELAGELKKTYPIRRVDLGGGLGVPYTSEEPPHPADYARLIVERIRHLDCALLLEPGRVIAGNAGILVCRVIYVKETGDRNFVIVDAAMNDLLRPALYGAAHTIIPAEEKSGDYVADIVGPVCETGDVLVRQAKLARPAEGDLLAVRTAGAYGAVMSNSYNSRLLVPEVLVNGGRFAVIRERPSYAEMLAPEKMPDWL